MKKVLLTAVVSALLVASCSQEEVVEILADIDTNPDSYKDIRFKHTYVLEPVPTSSEIINGIEYKDAVDQEKRSARTPLSYVSSKRREHVKFIADVYSDSHWYWLKFGLVGRAQKKKIGIWGNTFNDEMKWGQGYANVLVNKLAPQTVVAKRVENAKSSYNTDDGIFKLAPEGQFVYGAATGYFDCYKNDVSGEEHYKCHFILN